MSRKKEADKVLEEARVMVDSYCKKRDKAKKNRNILIGCFVVSSAVSTFVIVLAFLKYVLM